MMRGYLRYLVNALEKSRYVFQHPTARHCGRQRPVSPGGQTEHAGDTEGSERDNNDDLGQTLGTSRSIEFATADPGLTPWMRWQSCLIINNIQGRKRAYLLANLAIRWHQIARFSEAE